MDNSKKAVIITGASGGMGKAVCQTLSSNYKVFALDIKEPDNKDLNFIYCNVADEKSVAQAFDKIKEKTKEIYAIIHTAGIYDLDSLLEIEEERLLKIFNVNLFGAYRINKTFLPLLKKGSRIVTVTSELAPLSPLPFTGIYAITKTALENYAHSLRAELSLLGISVSVVRPGAVKTDMIGASTSALDKFCKRTKLYPVNAKRFKKIVDSVESKTVSPQKIAKKIEKALNSKKPKLTYNLNRNFLLRLLSALPKKLQVAILKTILK